MTGSEYLNDRVRTNTSDLFKRMLEILEDDNLKYAFNLIWEATSNMEKYVQTNLLSYIRR